MPNKIQPIDSKTVADVNKFAELFVKLSPKEQEDFFHFMRGAVYALEYEKHERKGA